MNKQIGLWIDHRRAVVVALTEGGEDIAHIASQVETQPRRSGDSPLEGKHEPQQVPADNRRQRSLTGHLNTYYDAVIDSIRDAQSVLIFGPGEAKGEFKVRLKYKMPNSNVVGVEPADKMMDSEIAAKVREYFDGHRLH